MTIDGLTNKVVASSTFKGPPMEPLIAEMQLQPRLDAILAEANAVDTELAVAINMAEGNAPIPAGPPSAPLNKQSGDSDVPPQLAQLQPQDGQQQTSGPINVERDREVPVGVHDLMRNTLTFSRKDFESAVLSGSDR